MSVFRVELVAFRKRLPQRAVAHDDRIDHAKGVESELVLAQNADALRANHVALLGIQFAGQDLHERRLAAAVRARQAIAPGGQEDGRHVFEQDFRAVAHADIAD